METLFFQKIFFPHNLTGYHPGVCRLYTTELNGKYIKTNLEGGEIKRKIQSVSERPRGGQTSCARMTAESCTRNRRRRAWSRDQRSRPGHDWRPQNDSKGLVKTPSWIRRRNDRTPKTRSIGAGSSLIYTHTTDSATTVITPFRRRGKDMYGKG